MECNRDEATRAKKIAEEKFAAKDIPGAKKFVLKAQNLYPELEGLSQMLAAFDVHLSAMKKIFGEPDLYGILGVNPEANEESVRKQYRKLALMLHPDKNKSIGADGAFKMISEAWSILGDKNKRNQYDQRTIMRTSQQKVSSAGQGLSAHPGGNGFNFSNIASSSIRAQNNVAFPGMRTPQQKVSSVSQGSSPAPRGNGFHNFSNIASSSIKAQSSSPGNATVASQQPVHNTFWTTCSACKMHYEYLRIYLNQHLLCHNCRKPFKAKETAPPPGFTPNSPLSSIHQHQNANHHISDKNMGYAGNQTNFQWSPFSKMDAHARSNASVSVAAQAASVVQQAMEKVQRLKREREEAETAARKLHAPLKKSHGSKRAAHSSPVTSTVSIPDTTERPAKKKNVSGEHRPNLGANIPLDALKTTVEPDSRKELTPTELRNMLTVKARKEIGNKLNELKLNALAKVAAKEKGKAKDVNIKEKEVTLVKSVSSGQLKSIGSVDAKKLEKDKKETPVISDANLNIEVPEPVLMSVPDPDFHDFDRDRCEKSFAENQVWAAYDDDDGMPRYYAQIHSVVSRSPFQMKISWLNSKTNSELGPLNWVGSGFAKTCGDLRVGKYELNNSLNSFSHRVRWTKGARGGVRIFPMKYDVWALYRNWSPDWNELTPDEVIHKYDMVHVLDDYNEEQGVNIIPLVKVAGFKTVFHQHLDLKQVRNIPREEMFRFSHQVPSYLLTDSEGRNAPKGCIELDPAATPLELLQIITEAKVAEMAEPAGEHERSEADVVVVNAEEKKEIELEKMAVETVKKDSSSTIRKDGFRNVYRKRYQCK